MPLLLSIIITAQLYYNCYFCLQIYILRFLCKLHKPVKMRVFILALMYVSCVHAADIMQALRANGCGKIADLIDAAGLTSTLTSSRK